MTLSEVIADCQARGIPLTVGPGPRLPRAEPRPASRRPGKRLLASVSVGVKECVAIDLPPSANNLFLSVGRRRAKTPEYRRWLRSAVPALRTLKPPAGKPFTVRITVYGGQGLNLSRDLGNFEKPITDAVVAAGVLSDDSIRAGLWKIALEYVPEPMRGGGEACAVVGVWEPQTLKESA